MDTLAIGRKSVLQFSFATPLMVQNGKRHRLQWGWLTGSEKPLSMGHVVGISPWGTSGKNKHTHLTKKKKKGVFVQHDCISL